MLSTILVIAAGLIAVAVVTLFGANIAVDMYMRSLLDKTQTAETIRVEEVSVYEGIDDTLDIENIVLLGIDSDDDSQTRSDAIKLISMDKTNHDITITSLQRDNLVYQPMQGRYEKLNHAYWYNGAEGSLAAINYNYDLDVTKYIAINFNGIAHLVDIVGGVDIELTQAEIYQTIRPLGISGDAGVYHLNGDQAVAYSRIRSIDDDYYRMNRQNLVIKGIIKEIKNKSIPEILNIINNAATYVETNLTEEDVKSYVFDIFNYDLNNIAQYQFPSRGMDNVVGDIMVSGWGPNYILDDFAGEVKIIHQQIYGDDGYEPSDNVYRVARETKELGGISD